MGYEIDTVDDQALSGTLDSMNNVVKYDSGFEAVEFTPIPGNVLGAQRYVFVRLGLIMFRTAKRFAVNMGELLYYKDDSSWKPRNDSYLWVV